MKKISRRRVLTKTMATIVAMVGGARFVTPVRAVVRKPEEHHIEINRFKFKPDFLRVKNGDTIIWTNRDIAPHTATARDNSWDTGEIIRGESKILQVTDEITKNYFCRFHPQMRAEIVVELEE